MSLPYKKPINERIDAIPSFLRNKKATCDISPASHNPLESFKRTLPTPRFFTSKDRHDRGLLNHHIKLKKHVPGAGTYDVKNINRAYDFITLGAGKSWK